MRYNTRSSTKHDKRTRKIRASKKARMIKKLEAASDIPPTKKRHKITSTAGSQKIVSEWDKIRRKVWGEMRKLNYHQTLCDAYQSEGWRKSNVEKLKPVKQLLVSQKAIREIKIKIRSIIKACDESHPEWNKIPPSAYDEDGMIDFSQIICSVCGELEDEDESNDVLLCDGKDCNMAFHQHCMDPPLAAEDIPPDDADFLCPKCSCTADCLVYVNDVFEQHWNCWREIFPEVDGDRAAESSDDSGPTEEVLEFISSDEDDFVITSASSDSNSDSNSDSDSDSDSDNSSSGEDDTLKFISTTRQRRNIQRVDYQKLNEMIFGDSKDEDEDADAVDSETSDDCSSSNDSSSRDSAISSNSKRSNRAKKTDVTHVVTRRGIDSTRYDTRTRRSKRKR